MLTRILILSVLMLMSGAVAVQAATRSDSLKVADKSGNRGNEPSGLFLNDPLVIDVLITEAKWSPEVGLNTIMGENWELTVQAGYRPRIFGYFSVGYRI